jgi:hypothetical protein
LEVLHEKATSRTEQRWAGQTLKREKNGSREQAPSYPKNGKYSEDNTENKPSPESTPLVLQVAMKVFDGVKTLF